VWRGTLIARKWVLTAARCIQSAKSYGVRVYGHSRQLEGQKHRCAQEVPVAKTICHDGYSPGESRNPGGREADICVLRLSYAPDCAAEMEAEGQLARLDEGDSARDSARTAVIVAGWVRTIENDHEYAEQARDRLTTMVAFSDCNTAYNGSLVEGSMICAGAVVEVVKDLCVDGSGGPLFLRLFRRSSLPHEE
jgi:secreted trypsin-like serine protease